MGKFAGFHFCILSILLFLTANSTSPQSWKSGKITFASVNWDVPGGERQWNIMNADGSDMTRLMDFPFQVGNHQYLMSKFILSPDCRKAAVVIETKDEAGNAAIDSDIAIFDIESHRLTNLTNGRLDCSSPRWSPGGRQIVFHSLGGKPEIYIINSDGTNIRAIGEGHSPDWSYDGKKIAFRKGNFGNYDIYTMDTDGRNPENITKGRVSDISPPRWSPDNRRILFHAGPLNGEDRIYVMNSDGSELQLVIKLLSSVVEGDACCWSPDGQKIAFPAKIKPETLIHIWAIDPDGSNLERFIDNSDNLEEFAIDWRDPSFAGIGLLSGFTATWGSIKAQ